MGMRRLVAGLTVVAASGGAILGLAGAASAMPQTQCALGSGGPTDTGLPRIHIIGPGEVGEGVGRVAIKVALSKEPTSDVTVTVCTADYSATAGTDVTPASDYRDVVQTLTFQKAGYRSVTRYDIQTGMTTTTWKWMPAETQKLVYVDIVNDTWSHHEAIESFALRVRSTSGASFACPQARVYIVDDDSVG